MFTKTTRDIKVTVFPNYLPDQSDPTDAVYVWAYTIHLENLGNQPAQLISRYWHITDGNGGVQEVRGPGVVGETPMLEPGEQYQYTSGVSLKTSSGIMQGNYQMEAENGDSFLIDIPPFSLDSPEQRQRPH
jgi:ApaG protein